MKSLIDLGFSPEDAAKKAREAFDDMSQGQGIKGTQVASGYKDDIEEMYEQYVFEMEEQVSNAQNDELLEKFLKTS